MAFAAETICVQGSNERKDPFGSGNTHIKQRKFDIFVYVQLVYQVKALKYEAYHAFAKTGTLRLGIPGDFRSVQIILSSCRVIK